MIDAGLNLTSYPLPPFRAPGLGPYTISMLRQRQPCPWSRSQHDSLAEGKYPVWLLFSLAERILLHWLKPDAG